MTRFIFLCCISFSAALSAANLCRDEVNGEQKTLKHLEIYQNNHYRVHSIRKGQHGGKIVTLALWPGRTGWRIPYEKSIHGDAPPGDPVLFYRALSRDLRKFFGFQILGEDGKILTTSAIKVPTYVEIPDFYEMTGALTKLDERLRSNGYDGIPFSFSLDKEVINAHQFLLYYLNDKKFPFALHNEVSFHDLNYHFLPLMVLNKKMIDASIPLTEIFLKFANWLTVHHGNTVSKKDLEELYGIRAHHIDLTGNISVYLHSPQAPKATEHAVTAIKTFIGAGLSPEKYLMRVILEAKSSRGPQFLRGISEQKVSDFIKTLEPQYLQENSELRSIAKDTNKIFDALRNRMSEMEAAVLGISNSATN